MDKKSRAKREAERSTGAALPFAATPAAPAQAAQPRPATVPLRAPAKAKHQKSRPPRVSARSSAVSKGKGNPPSQPATAPGQGAGSSSGRFKWTDTEVELLFRVEELTQELFDSANAARQQQQQEDRLDLPTHTAQAQVLSALLPHLNQSILISRYASIGRGTLPRPPATQLPDEYSAAAQEATELLLSAAETDAEATTKTTATNKTATKTKRKPAAAAAAGGVGRAVRQRDDDGAGLAAAPSHVVASNIMPGAQPEHAPDNPRRLGKTTIPTLGHARQMEIKPHRMQRDQVLMLHDDHELFTWYQCTDQICQWGKKKCSECEKQRPLKAHSLYSVEWSMVTYPDASGEWSDSQIITVKFMCPGCALK